MKLQRKKFKKSMTSSTMQSSLPKFYKRMLTHLSIDGVTCYHYKLFNKYIWHQRQPAVLPKVKLYHL